MSRNWSGLVMPAKTPPDIVARVNAAANKALLRDDTQKIMRDQGYEVLGGGADDLAAWRSRDLANEQIRYLFLDGWYPKVRLGKQRVRVPVQRVADGGGGSRHVDAPRCRYRAEVRVAGA